MLWNFSRIKWFESTLLAEIWASFSGVKAIPSFSTQYTDLRQMQWFRKRPVYAPNKTWKQRPSGRRFHSVQRHCRIASSCSCLASSSVRRSPVSIHLWSTLWLNIANSFIRFQPVSYPQIPGITLWINCCKLSLIPVFSFPVVKLSIF